MSTIFEVIHYYSFSGIFHCLLVLVTYVICTHYGRGPTIEHGVIDCKEPEGENKTSITRIFVIQNFIHSLIVNKCRIEYHAERLRQKHIDNEILGMFMGCMLLDPLTNQAIVHFFLSAHEFTIWSHNLVKSTCLFTKHTYMLLCSSTGSKCISLLKYTTAELTIVFQY